MSLTWREVRRALEAQGFEIRDKKNGYLIVAPNGYTDTVHRNPKETSLVKSVGRLRNRGGFKWPPPSPSW